MYLELFTLVKKQPAELKRFVSLQMDIKNLQELEGFVLDFNSQKILGLKDGQPHPLIGSAQLEFKRERKNKEAKMLHSSSSAGAESYFSANHQLFTYDHIIAVDTNTNYVCGSSVSITAAYHFIPKYITSNSLSGCGSILALLEHWNVVEKPENLGWWQILQALRESIDFFKGKIALIVDSDLGEHQAFNSREKPIYKDFYLPKDVTIIYASDVGSFEHLSTKMIKYCHDIASELYKNENLLINIKDLRPGIEGQFSHFRQWDADSVLKGAKLKFKMLEQL